MLINIHIHVFTDFILRGILHITLPARRMCLQTAKVRNKCHTSYAGNAINLSLSSVVTSKAATTRLLMLQRVRHSKRFIGNSAAFTRTITSNCNETLRRRSNLERKEPVASRYSCTRQSHALWRRAEPRVHHLGFNNHPSFSKSDQFSLQFP
jgi:hypothetical protein